MKFLNNSLEGRTTKKTVTLNKIRKTCKAGTTSENVIKARKLSYLLKNPINTVKMSLSQNLTLDQ